MCFFVWRSPNVNLHGPDGVYYMLDDILKNLCHIFLWKETVTFSFLMIWKVCKFFFFNRICFLGSFWKILFSCICMWNFLEYWRWRFVNEISGVKTYSSSLSSAESRLRILKNWSSSYSILWQESTLVSNYSDVTTIIIGMLIWKE